MAVAGGGGRRIGFFLLIFNRKTEARKMGKA
jgi:hypothetical protein